MKKECKKFTTQHVHVEPLNIVQWRNHILFRDYLNHNKPLIKEYSNLKKDLEKEPNISREEYTIKKAPFIQKIIKKAEIYEDRLSSINF